VTTLVWLPPPEELPGDGPGGRVRYRRAPNSLEEALAAIEAEDCQRVIVLHPGPPNAFALARRLFSNPAIRVCLVAEPRPDLRFWAERWGCDLFADLASAIQT